MARRTAKKASRLPSGSYAWRGRAVAFARLPKAERTRIRAGWGRKAALTARAKKYLARNELPLSLLRERGAKWLLAREREQRRASKLYQAGEVEAARKLRDEWSEEDAEEFDEEPDSPDRYDPLFYYH